MKEYKVIIYGSSKVHQALQQWYHEQCFEVAESDASGTYMVRNALLGLLKGHYSNPAWTKIVVSNVLDDRDGFLLKKKLDEMKILTEYTGENLVILPN